METQTCLIPPIPAPTPHRHRALFREIGIIKVTFELSSPSSAHGITHNDIQRSPDHIYDSIFDTVSVSVKNVTSSPSVTLAFSHRQQTLHIHESYNKGEWNNYLWFLDHKAIDKEAGYH